MLTNLV